MCSKAHHKELSIEFTDYSDISMQSQAFKGQETDWTDFLVKIRYCNMLFLNKKYIRNLLKL